MGTRSPEFWRVVCWVFGKKMMKGQILKKRYRILEQIGSGGFGETYKAEYPIDLPNETKFYCVIKRLKSKYQDDSDIVERFEREAALLKGLENKHAQVPQFIDYFTEDRDFFSFRILLKVTISATKLLQIINGKKMNRFSFYKKF